jgi:hypothetical protein
MGESNEEARARQVAALLPRLAEPERLMETGQALFNLMMEDVREASAKDRAAHDYEADGRRVYERAAELIADDLDRLIPAWIERLLELLRAQHRRQQELMAAIRAGDEMPEIDLAGILAHQQLEKALVAAGPRMDPHIGPLISAFGMLGRDADEHLCAPLEHAGPGVSAAVPAMLQALRTHGVWCWPSHLSAALARANEFDARVLPELRTLLSSDLADTRHAAMNALAALGPRAKPAARELLDLGRGAESDRSLAMHALSRIGEATPEVLDLLEAAIRDPSGYVRRSAAAALGELRPDPNRFVPLLAAACDDTECLHDESLPEAAVRALAEYGPAAYAALPRLMRFLEGPVKERTVEADLVREAVERIAAGGARGVMSVSAPEKPFEPPQRSEPASHDEPLWPVPHQGRLCYIDGRGRVVIQTDYSWGEPFSDGRAIVRDESTTAVIDRTGRTVFQSTWDDIKAFSESLAAVKKEKKWGFVDLNGNVVVDPRYDSVTRFSERLAGVELGRMEGHNDSGISMDTPGRRGFINRSGRVVIPLEWIECYPFQDGRAVVCTGGVMKPHILFEDRMVLSERKYGYIDSTGALVIRGVYSLAAPFSEGLAAVESFNFGRERAGYINAQGRVVLPLKYTSAGQFSGGHGAGAPPGKTLACKSVCY